MRCLRSLSENLFIDPVADLDFRRDSYVIMGYTNTQYDTTCMIGHELSSLAIISVPYIMILNVVLQLSKSDSELTKRPLL